METRYYIRTGENRKAQISKSIALKNMHTEYPMFRRVYNALKEGDKFGVLEKYSTEERAELSRVFRKLGFSSYYVMVREEASSLHEKITKKNKQYGKIQ